MVLAALGLLALRPLLAPAPPEPLALVVLRGECQLAPVGSAPPCPCERTPAAVRRLLGLPLSLNDSTASDLEELPGIGPVRAAAMVAERENSGAFASPADLVRVHGIGERTATRLADLVFVGEADPACESGPASRPLPAG